jgi:hypothetical protein
MVLAVASYVSVMLLGIEYPAVTLAAEILPVPVLPVAADDTAGEAAAIADGFELLSEKLAREPRVGWIVNESPFVIDPLAIDMFIPAMVPLTAPVDEAVN